MEQDSGQDGVASPTTPGTGKSKLDTLAKEDLIKFAKKQVIVLQKVKSRCTELEKEVEELKSKTPTDGTEDVIQALTDRLDAVLLEKAEAQQQLVSLKKENGKIKLEAEDAAKKAVELQDQWEKSSTDRLKEFESLKNELEMLRSSHKDEVCMLHQKLQESADQQLALEEKIALHSNQQDNIKTLEKELQQMRPTYEEQILHLNKQLEAAIEQKNLESKRQEHHQVEIADLRNELLKLKSTHQVEVSKLVHQLETHGKEYEQERKKVNKLIHDITEQFLSKEKTIQEMLNENKVTYEQEIMLLRASIDKNITEVPTVSSLESETEENVEHLDYVLKKHESQLSILRDELTYTNNVKLKLDLEIQHLKDDFFHEREDLEFKINELQLAKEDCGCLIETLQYQLRTANDNYEVMLQRHNQEILVLRDQHKKEILDLKEKLISSAEEERASLIFEMKVLKEQCEKLLHEKEDAVSNYESLKETLVTLQNELGESAGKISREFKTLKEQQATDLQELQQKLRTAYNEKDALLETVNSLKAEIEALSAKHAEYEEIRQTLSGFQARNEEMVISLQQKDALLKELEERVNNLGLKNIDLLTSLEASREELSKLQDVCTKERACVLELQQNTEALTQNNSQLKLQCEEWVEKLKETKIERDQNVKKLAQMESEFEAVWQEKEKLVSDVQFLNSEVVKLNEEKSTMRRDIDGILFERGDDLAFKEQIETLQNKLQLASVEKEELSTLYAKGQQQKLLDEEKLLSKVQALQNEVGRLLEEKKAISRDFERFLSERDGPLAVKEHIENLNNKQHLGNEENKELRDQQKKILHDEKILSEVQALCIEVENLCEEKERLSNVFERDQQQKLFNEKKLLTEVQALHIEVENLSHEKEKLTKDIENLVSERDYFLSNKEECVNLQSKLQMIAVEKDHLSKLYEKEQHHKLLNEEKYAAEVQALQLKVEKLLEEKETMSCNIKRFAAERDDSLTARPQIEDLQFKLQLAVAEKEEVSKLFESEQKQKLLIESRLSGLLEQMDSMPPKENKDIMTILEAVHESIARLKKESQSVVFQSNERCLLFQQDLERLQGENEAQVAELKSLIEDYAKEKVLLKAELEAAVSQKESMKGDLLDMKSANEKSKLENRDLLARIEEFTKNIASQVKEQQEQPPEAVQKNMEDLPDQKGSDLYNLSTECKFLKDSVAKSLAVESNQQSAITELQLKIANLENICKEKEEKLNKFKAVAVKAKKELDSSRKEVQALKENLESVKNEKSQLSTSLKELIQGAESYKNLLVEYDKQAEQLDVAKERAEYSERQIEEITKQLQASYQQLEKLNSEKEDLLARIETLQTNTRLLESQILDLQRSKTSVDKELEAEKLLKEQKAKEHIAALKQIEDIQAQLQKEKKQAQITMHELELLRKDAQKSTLMDMEMADYDRLVKELNQKISDKNSRLEDLEQEIRLQKQREETLNEEIVSLQASVEQYEERGTKMKQLLLKTKKELADSKQAETDHLLLQASLKGELEASQQQVESFKIQVAELTAEKHRLQEQLRTCIEQQQRNTNAYQQKIASLQDAYTMAKADQAAVSAEFESYKVRVHNVFKQQKNKSSSQIENEAVKQEREHLDMMLEQLKHKLQDSQHNLQISTTELHTLQADHDTLLERHNKMLQETVAKEAELREKLCTVQSENMVMKSEHAQILSQLTAQNEALRNNFRDQIRHMQEDHRKTTETLQQQLSKLEGQLFQQQQQQIESNITSPSASQPPMKNLRERRATDVPILDMYIAAREEGEGMEMTDTDSVSSASTYLPPLEQLLNSPESKFELPQWQPELSKEEIVQKLNTTSKSIDHLSGLLHETEATNAILMEQITLLKNEIRRLERNQERDKSVSNLEYLKNVVLQFIFLKPGSERQRLLPVIDTMLHLSPEEKGKLVAIALGEEEAAARPAGWASYLHSWSGLR